MSKYDFGEALKHVKAKRQNFILFIDGKETRLLIAPTALPTDLVQSAKNEAGGREVKGVCALEDNQKLVFFTKAEPKDAWQLKVSKLVKAEHYTHPIEFRQLNADEAEEVTAASGSKVAYAKLRLAWDAARKHVHADLQKLEQAILDEYKGDAELPDVQKKVRKLDEILETFSADLGDQLDLVYTAETDDDRAVRKESALEIIDDYVDALDDEFIDDIETNPFVTVTVRKTLSDTLRALKAQLAH